VKTTRIVALILQPTHPKFESRTWAGFNDGSRLLVSQLLTKNDHLHATSAGQSFVAPLKSLVFLQPLDGRAVYLSDLQPTEYEQTPYLNLTWPYRNDRNVTGGLLRSDGRLFLKGLGVHSAARLVYDVSGERTGEKDSHVSLTQGQSKTGSPFPLGEGQGVRAVRAPTLFQAELAIDDSAASGSVQFRVLVDGVERYTSPVIRGGQPPVPISVNIRSAKKLELIVDYADRADVLDHADWLNARLTK
jgi:hypothetical protein